MAAAAGHVPDELHTLEQGALAPLAPGGGQVRAPLRGDCTRTRTGPTAAPDRGDGRTAIELGHEYLALTDHSPRLTVANGLTPKRLRGQLALVAALTPDLAPFRLLTGIEVDILADGVPGPAARAARRARRRGGQRALQAEDGLPRR